MLFRSLRDAASTSQPHKNQSISKLPIGPVLALNRIAMKSTKQRKESVRLQGGRMTPQPKKAAMLRVSLVVLTLLTLAAYQQSKPQDNSNYNGLDLVDKTGNIRKPADYRDRYPTLGTFFVRDPVGAEEMHY